METFQSWVGYRFKPDEEELVKGFLLQRVKGDPLPSSPIIDCDLYGKKTPWEIFNEATDQKTWYSFTRLKKTSKKRISRVAGGGTWRGETCGVEISDGSGKVIGVKKTFSFSVKGDRSKKNNWIMHEFSLAGESLLSIGEESCDLVLCKIKKKGKKAGGICDQSAVMNLPKEVRAVRGNFDGGNQFAYSREEMFQERMMNLPREVIAAGGDFDGGNRFEYSRKEMFQECMMNLPKEVTAAGADFDGGNRFENSRKDMFQECMMNLPKDVIAAGSDFEGGDQVEYLIEEMFPKYMMNLPGEVISAGSNFDGGNQTEYSTEKIFPQYMINLPSEVIAVGSNFDGGSQTECSTEKMFPKYMMNLPREAIAVGSNFDGGNQNEHLTEEMLQEYMISEEQVYNNVFIIN